jgi:hypothetical protein
MDLHCEERKKNGPLSGQSGKLADVAH